MDQPPQPPQPQPPQPVENQLLTALVAQITAVKQSVDQLRNDTGVNQAETQRLHEAIDRQRGTQAINIVKTNHAEDTQSTSGTQSTYSTAVGMVAQPYKKLYDLPIFSGKPDDWPLFLANYEETTANFGYSAVENTIRLQKCLQGEAREAVSSLLIYPNNVTQVIKALSFRFGRPDLLVKAQLTKVQQFPTISDARVECLISFSTMVENVVAFLSSAKCEQHLANPMLLEELILKLPMTRRFEWARHASTIEPYATVKDFAKWLTELAKIVQLVPQSSTSVVRGQPSQPRRILHANEKNFGEIRNSPKVVCICCGESHQVGDCKTFKGLATEDRWKLVKTKHLCFSCIKFGHGAATCRSRRRCDQNGCRKFHHKLLHEGEKKVSPQAPERIQNCRTQNYNSQLFRILPVVLLGPRGQKSVYAMFDEGSSISILEDGIATELGLQGQMQSLTLQWFGDKVVTQPSRKVALEISGAEKGSRFFQMRNVRTVQNLSLPIQSFNKECAQHLRSIPVSNYKDAVPVILIGLDNCHLGLAGTSIEGGQDEPIAAHTKLGWVTYGPRCANANDNPMVLHINETEILCNLDKVVESYFTVENFGVHKTDTVVESIDDARAREILERTTRRVDKQFETGLLWRNDEFTMPDSYQMASKRLFNIEAKMQRDQDFSKRYKCQIANYIQSGYARELSPNDAEANSSRIWYLPHFGVTNPHKPDKLRIVFDAAAEVHRISLNSMLLKGPEQAKPLLTILFKFRQGVVGVVADIKEMFSQVKIRVEDQNAQRFLWRDGNKDQPIRIYIMSSMIFGAACSPCAAEYIKNKNATAFQKNSPEAVDAIVNNHYVDDFVCSFHNQVEAERISLEVKKIHAEGGFMLRNFVSNIKAVEAKLNDPLCRVQSAVSLESDEGGEKVLGMYWHTEDDTFRFRFKFHRISKEVLESSRPPTKREVLGIVMAVFDPYGFLGDFLIFSKILLQNTWKTGIGWDDPLPDNLHSRWKLWWIELKNVKQFRLNRCYSPKLPLAQDIELHIFTDASESAFAAVGYFRIQHQRTVDVAFAFGKTRCAPKKLLSIPRLELQAAVLGSRLQSAIRSNHNFAISRVVYWSDSKTTIWWIRSPHRRFKPFVAHRIAEILDASDPSDWRWVPTDLNVADDATRAINPPKFVKNSRWLSGPEFLRLPEHLWPCCSDALAPDTLDEELRPRIFHIGQASAPLVNVANFSSYSKLRRVVAWMLRCLQSLRRARERIAAQRNGEPMSKQITRAPIRQELTAEEILSAEYFLCKQAQKEEFFKERSSLKKEEPISKSSVIYELTPYLDEGGLLRLKGRIDAAYCLPADARRPIILPQRHTLTQLIVYHYHHFLHHQNDALTINEIRQRYWVPRIKSVLKRVKQNCQECKIARAKPVIPLMGQLPPDRLTPFIRPFSYTGLDYFGPLQVSVGRRREKRWVALFTCLTTRAIHLELAADLSTDALILCLRNFVNRRGTPIRIRSDNGTNFIGARKELKLEAQFFDTDRIQNEMTKRGIDWKFICPLNPSEGGVWERMVQSVKKILRVTLREEAPRVETLRSLLIEAENIINSRPLTELPVNSEEDEPLTPNHFLIGCLNSTQTPNLEDSPICCRKQWKISQQLKNRFWKRWVLEYLPMLTRRSKWHATVPPLKVGNLVIICDASQPRSKWQRGRITKVYPAKDGQVRSAEVKTLNGTLRRPASKLAVIQICGESPLGFTEGGMSSPNYDSGLCRPVVELSSPNYDSGLCRPVVE